MIANYGGLNLTSESFSTEESNVIWVAVLALSLTTNSLTAILCLSFLFYCWEGFSDNPETGLLESTDNWTNSSKWWKEAGSSLTCGCQGWCTVNIFRWKYKPYQALCSMSIKLFIRKDHKPGAAALFQEAQKENSHLLQHWCPHCLVSPRNIDLFSLWETITLFSHLRTWGRADLEGAVQQRAPHCNMTFVSVVPSHFWFTWSAHDTVLTCGTLQHNIENQFALCSSVKSSKVLNFPIRLSSQFKLLLSVALNCEAAALFCHSISWVSGM